MKNEDYRTDKGFSIYQLLLFVIGATATFLVKDMAFEALNLTHLPKWGQLIGIIVACCFSGYVLAKMHKQVKYLIGIGILCAISYGILLFIEAPLPK